MPPNELVVMPNILKIEENKFVKGKGWGDDVEQDDL